MAHRSFIFGTKISWVLLGLTLLLGLSTFWISPWDHSLSITKGFHVGMWGRGWDIRCVVFNSADYGPYRGSIVGIADALGNIHPPLEREVGFGDTAGVYYRYFRWAGGSLWTFMMSLGYPVAFFAILPVCWLVGRWRRSGSKLANGASRVL